MISKKILNMNHPKLRQKIRRNLCLSLIINNLEIKIHFRLMKTQKLREYSLKINKMISKKTWYIIKFLRLRNKIKLSQSRIINKQLLFKSLHRKRRKRTSSKDLLDFLSRKIKSKQKKRPSKMRKRSKRLLNFNMSI